MEKFTLRTVAIVAASLLLKWLVSYHSYSGQGKPPMFGDYEAQRHWQEVTVNLPMKHWYKNSSINDLQYWGLDYPPLTAYHSYALGRVAETIDPKFVKLHESRGFESDNHKFFMRLTVLIADCLTYTPAIVLFVLTVVKPSQDNCHHQSSNFLGLAKADFILITALIYPGLTLIDHGHFQYNCVSLGLFAFAIIGILSDRFLFASLFFVLALNYKQMELYHAPPFFFYILGQNFKPAKGKSLTSSLLSISSVGATVIFTFAIVWLPFIQDWDTFTSVITRLFPFARGVYEDKVANVWCTLNVVYKLNLKFTNIQLAKICALATSLAILPTSLDLTLRPCKEKFLLSLVNCPLAFFLFSYHVHEKSILLVAIPLVLHFHEEPLPCCWFLLISVFSMLPLLIKDNLYLAYFATAVFYAFAVSWMWNELPDFTSCQRRQVMTQLKGNVSDKHKKHSMSSRKSKSNNNRSSNELSRNFNNLLKNYLPQFQLHYAEFCEGVETTIEYLKETLVFRLFYLSMFVAVLLSVCTGFVKPPKRYPDLFPLLISVYSFVHFFAFLLYFNYRQFKIVNNNNFVKYKTK